MDKLFHEVRDPLLGFVRFSRDERKVIDSRAFQRLRHIHQLAMTFLVYPGATHKRFEHSLGVMELASKIFDTITGSEILPEIRTLIPEIQELEYPSTKSYWRNVLRIAALCHDLGHLPFSHAAERELLPDGWDHEGLTKSIIESEEMKKIWDSILPPLKIEHIVKLALGPIKAKKYGILNYTNWEAILSEIITGDVFGADRIDYLLRDSHHVGVAYGRFDHYRLIDTLRILPPPPTGNKESPEEASMEPMLGIEEGGLYSAEALLLARYFMFSQVYCHRVRRIYDIHLKDFLASWLSSGVFSTEVEDILAITDNEVFGALRKAAMKESEAGHDHAKRIILRNHLKELYRCYPEDREKNPFAVEAIYQAVKCAFKGFDVRKDEYLPKENSLNFPVLRRDDEIVSSISLSQTLRHIPSVVVGYVYVDHSICENAGKWLKANKESILKIT